MKDEALRLADKLDREDCNMSFQDIFAAAAELRRLLAQRDALLEALQRSRAQWIHSVNAEFCLAAIARAEENT
jgi:hypothetical protein